MPRRSPNWAKIKLLWFVLNGDGTIQLEDASGEVLFTAVPTGKVQWFLGSWKPSYAFYEGTFTVNRYLVGHVLRQNDGVSYHINMLNDNRTSSNTTSLVLFQEDLRSHFRALFCCASFCKSTSWFVVEPARRSILKEKLLEAIPFAAHKYGHDYFECPQEGMHRFRLLANEEGGVGLCPRGTSDEVLTLSPSDEAPKKKFVLELVGDSGFPWLNPVDGFAYSLAHHSYPISRNVDILVYGFMYSALALLIVLGVKASVSHFFLE